MLKIAVCDDQDIELELLKLHLEQYRTLRDCRGLTFDLFASSGDLVEKLREDGGYDLFILDIMMPEYDGVEVGRAIRAAGSESPIIYITASAEFALDAISVHPEQYLLKPLDPAALYQVLDAVMPRLEDRRQRCLTVKTRDGIEVLSCREIVCVEHAGRVMRVYTADRTVRESVYLRESFESLVAPLLSQPGFVQPHKSYIVNLRHVRAMQSGGFLTDTGMEIPISRRNMGETKQQYLRYLGEE